MFGDSFFSFAVDFGFLDFFFIFSSTFSAGFGLGAMGTTPRLDEVIERFEASCSFVLSLLVLFAGDIVLLWTCLLLEAALGDAMLVSFWGTVLEEVLGGEGRGTTPPAYDDSTLLLELLASDPNGFPRAVLILGFGFGLASVRGFAGARGLAGALA